ncbi:serine--tRNA ligase [Paenibacillus sp. YYML68]|uniref:serine--tRNA ligase n=1 Tax=Paenibacillus sp. YYML68 TaxID=2909250 RepID=UPI002492BAAD|nr:serine--tRNA ligase [Paenibacillus sp. YYML68]
MLDVKLLRSDLELVKQAMANRGKIIEELDRFTELDTKRRELLQEVEQLKNRRNVVSQEVAQLKKAKENADHLIEEMKVVGDRIKQLDEEIRELEAELDTIILAIPNVPQNNVPIGHSEEENVELRRIGDVPSFSFEPKPHWEIAQQLDIIDFEAAAKVTGSRFVFYKGLGARLERALYSFMMDLHADQHGYEEMLPPLIVNRDSLMGTGQLPKFEEDVFKLDGLDYYLIPTAEVPVTNYHRDDILTLEDLPKHYVAYSACFRSEAGSAGRDTRGLIRQHQFNKIELVKLTTPESSNEELEKLTSDAEKVLQLLNLPYRVMALCTGDLGFTSSKTYDLEVWLPSGQSYREISSCSNFQDFQARRANIRFRRDQKAKPEFVHTLNGSGLAIGRTVAAILENFQQDDGSVLIPEALRPYMGGIERISKK